MATNLRLEYETASAQAKVVMAQADEINRILNSLVSEVEANINNSSVWTGDSANKFKGAWDRCADNFNTFVNHIKTIQEKIDYTANEVKQFDQN